MSRLRLSLLLLFAVALGFGLRGLWDSCCAPSSSRGSVEVPSVAFALPDPGESPRDREELSKGGRSLRFDPEVLMEFRAKVDAVRAERAAQPTLRPWPKDIGRDSAELWPQRLEEIVRQCGGERTWVSSDCSEFPCVGLLRGPPSVGHVVKLIDLFGSDCDVLNEDSPDAEHGVLLDYEVDCPDGATETMLLFATGDIAALLEVYRDAPGREVNKLIQDLGRRSTALVEAWPCGGE